MTESTRVIDPHVNYYTDEYVEAVIDADTISTYRRADGRLVAVWRSDTTLTFARLSYSGLVERYPRIRWIFSHLGSLAMDETERAALVGGRALALLAGRSV